MNYLDLEMYTVIREKKCIHVPTFPTSIGHHPKWIAGIPNGQLMRIKRTCYRLEDYKEQSNTLIDRFIEKGYKRPYLQKVQKEVNTMNREELLIPPKKE